MSSSTPKLRKVGGSKSVADTDPNFIRSLVSSTPLHEAPVTAVVDEAAKDTAHNDTRPGAWSGHLAQLLHSMYLVTFTEKAQLGAMYSRNGGTSATSSSSTSTTGKHADTPACSHSVTVDARWLGAVTRYCHFTSTFDDVARVAMVFPTLIQVRWSVEDHKRRGPETLHSDGLSEPLTPQATGTTFSDSRLLSNDQSTAVHVPSGGKLVARVYLTQDHVISVEEAAAQLKDSFARKGGPSAQRTWRALVNNHTAYTAYVDSLRSASAPLTVAITPSPDAPRSDGGGGGGGHPCAEGEGKDVHMSEDTLDGATDEELCATISAELRASLSAPRLKALLRQMRNDATHVEEAEQQRIAQRQLQERLLSAYEHVRSLYGPKDTRGRSALALTSAMQRESRFEDSLDILALLSSLLEIPASGLSATMLREGGAVAELVPPTPTTGVATRGKRKRAAQDEEELRGSANAPVAVRVIEPTLEPVTDLRNLTEAQLDLVLVSLDRSKGSVRGVIEATSLNKL